MHGFRKPVMESRGRVLMGLPRLLFLEQEGSWGLTRLWLWQRAISGQGEGEKSVSSKNWLGLGSLG